MGIGRKSPKGAYEWLSIDKRKKVTYTITEFKEREHFKKELQTMWKSVKSKDLLMISSSNRRVKPGAKVQFMENCLGGKNIMIKSTDKWKTFLRFRCVAEHLGEGSSGFQSTLVIVDVLCVKTNFSLNADIKLKHCWLSWWWFLASHVQPP